MRPWCWGSDVAEVARVRGGALCIFGELPQIISYGTVLCTSFNHWSDYRWLLGFSLY